LYRVRIDGSGKDERLTPSSLPGMHSYDISPRGDFAIHYYTTFNKVPITEIVRVPDHTLARTLMDNHELQARIDKLKTYSERVFPRRHRRRRATRRLDDQAAGFRSAKTLSVLFHVYGEPWGQTVLDGWGGRNALWHRMLAQQGYIVMSVDNRGTPAPRGRAWRKIVYRKIGVVSSADQANAARAIAKWPFVDPSRIGIWGWSGGGSSTLNAMFRYPDVYATGVSVAPVPISITTTRSTRNVTAAAERSSGEWKQSSPITFARS
jgi:dipeptidyl-peptidase-4